MVKVKRIYDLPATDDGYRILVDRLWPRGVSKEKARVDQWMKELAPSTELRQWYNHDHVKWPDFLKQYSKEIAESPWLDDLVSIIRREKVVTLLFASSEEQYNNATALRGIVAQLL